MTTIRSLPTLAISLAALVFVAWLAWQGAPSDLYLPGPVHG